METAFSGVVELFDCLSDGQAVEVAVGVGIILAVLTAYIAI